MLDTTETIIVKLILCGYFGLVITTLIALGWEKQGKEATLGLRAGWFFIGMFFAIAGLAPFQITFGLDTVIDWLILGSLIGTLVTSRMLVEWHDVHPLTTWTVGLTSALVGLSAYYSIGYGFGVDWIAITLPQLVFAFLGAIAMGALIVYARRSLHL